MPDIDEGDGGTYQGGMGGVKFGPSLAPFFRVPLRWKPAKWWRPVRIWATGFVVECPYCGTATVSRQGQRAHERMHSEEWETSDATAPDDDEETETADHQ